MRRKASSIDVLTLRRVSLRVRHHIRIADTEADFLFKPEIPAYLDEIVRRAWELRSAHSEYRDFTQPVTPEYDHQKVTNEMHKQEVWFNEQHEAAKLKFKKYLDISR